MARGSPALQALAAAILDGSAMAFETVFVAGRRGLQVELDPVELARLSGASIASIVRP